MCVDFGFRRASSHLTNQGDVHIIQASNSPKLSNILGTTNKITRYGCRSEYSLEREASVKRLGAELLAWRSDTSWAKSSTQCCLCCFPWFVRTAFTFSLIQVDFSLLPISFASTLLFRTNSTLLGRRRTSEKETRKVISWRRIPY